MEEEDGSPMWALYFDREDDGLQSEERVGTQRLRMLSLEVWRRELRMDHDSAVENRLDRLRAREEKSSSNETTVS